MYIRQQRSLFESCEEELIKLPDKVSEQEKYIVRFKDDLAECFRYFGDPHVFKVKIVKFKRRYLDNDTIVLLNVKKKDW